MSSYLRSVLLKIVLWSIGQKGKTQHIQQWNENKNARNIFVVNYCSDDVRRQYAGVSRELNDCSKPTANTVIKG